MNDSSEKRQVSSKQNTYRAANFCFYCKRGPQDHIGPEMECPSDETCDQRGPYCPETYQACERMCQSICNVRTGEPAKTDP